MPVSVCQTYSRPVLLGYVAENPEVLLLQPRCKQWSCSYCASMNTLLWRERIRQGIEEYQGQGFMAWSFVTITMSAKTRGYITSLNIWPKGWSKLSTRIRRRWPGLKYVLLPELHKDGTLHTHSIMSADINNTWLSKNAHSSGLGYKSIAEPMPGVIGAVFYVTKYLTKTTGVGQWPPYFRRIRTSQNWPELIDEDGYTPISAEWRYLASYPNDGLEYLAAGLTAKTGIVHKVI